MPSPHVLHLVEGHLKPDMPVNWAALTSQEFRHEQTLLTILGHSSVLGLQLLKPVRHGYQVRLHTLLDPRTLMGLTELHVSYRRVGLLTVDAAKNGGDTATKTG